MWVDVPQGTESLTLCDGRRVYITATNVLGPRGVTRFISVPLFSFGCLDDATPEITTMITELDEYVGSSLEVSGSSEIPPSHERWVNEGLVLTTPRKGRATVWGANPLRVIKAVREIEQGRFESWSPTPTTDIGPLGEPRAVLVTTTSLAGCTWIGHLAYVFLGMSAGVLLASLLQTLAH